MLLIHYSINNHSHQHTVDTVHNTVHFSDKEDGVNKQMHEPFLESKSHCSFVASQGFIFFVVFFLKTLFKVGAAWTELKSFLTFCFVLALYEKSSLFCPQILPQETFRHLVFAYPRHLLVCSYFTSFVAKSNLFYFVPVVILQCRLMKIPNRT